jgi:hypothetical protein
MGRRQGFNLVSRPRRPTWRAQGACYLARMFPELMSGDREDGGATRSASACVACRATVPRYRGIGSELYLNGTSQGPTPEDARLPARRAYSSERRTAISVVAASDS